MNTNILDKLSNEVREELELYCAMQGLISDEEAIERAITKGIKPEFEFKVEDIQFEENLRAALKGVSDKYSVYAGNVYYGYGASMIDNFIISILDISNFEATEEREVNMYFSDGSYFVLGENGQVNKKEREVVRFVDMEFDQKVDVFLTMFSGHDKEPEITEIFAIMAAYSKKIDEDLILEHYSELCVEEIKRSIEVGLNGDCDEEDVAWKSIISALGEARILDILENSEKYLDVYIPVVHAIYENERLLYKMMTELLSKI